MAVAPKTPLVSVLLPSYNHAQYITEAIMSVVEQTYEPIELIVIDDGSTDGSADIIADLSRKYGFFFEAQKNQGLLKTLERLQHRATGTYISFFASDDVYARTKLDTLVRFLRLNPDCAMVYSKVIQIDAQSREILRINEPYKYGYIFRELLRGDFFINGLGALVRTDILNQYRRFDTFIDDYPLWLQIARDHCIGFVDEYLAFYRMHSNHLTSDYTRMQKSEEEILASFRDSEYYREAINCWNVRWFNAFVERDRMMAIRFFFSRLSSPRYFVNPRVIIGLLKLLFPRKVLERMQRLKNVLQR